MRLERTKTYWRLFLGRCYVTWCFKSSVVAVLVLALCTSVAAAPTRSRAAATAFKKQSGFPHGRAGYLIDHIIPLCAGGADTPANMQWEAIKESYVKDNYERKLCAAMKRQHLILVTRTP